MTVAKSCSRVKGFASEACLSSAVSSTDVSCVLALEPSVSQLIDAIGQNQLEILKENAEECLDLWKSKEKPVTVEDEVPITQWEAERKKEVSLSAGTS